MRGFIPSQTRGVCDETRGGQTPLLGEFWWLSGIPIIGLLSPFIGKAGPNGTRFIAWFGKHSWAQFPRGFAWNTKIATALIIGLPILLWSGKLPSNSG